MQYRVSPHSLVLGRQDLVLSTIFYVIVIHLYQTDPDLKPKLAEVRHMLTLNQN